MKQPLFFLRRAFAETPRVAVNVVATAPTAPLRPEDVASANILFVSESVPDATAAALRKEIENGKTAVVVVRSTQIAPTLTDYDSHSAERLDVAGVKELLLTLPPLVRELEEWRR